MIKLSKSKHFNPNKSFLSLRIVWLVTILFIVISLSIAIIITINSRLQLDLSGSGFNYFISTFRFPLGILTLIIPVVALLASNHRSEQTKEQIRLNGIQNNFVNYYKHLEEFSKYVEAYEIKTILPTKTTRQLHHVIFPYAEQGDYTLNNRLLDEWYILNSNLHILLKLKPNDPIERAASDLKIKIKAITYPISNLISDDCDCFISSFIRQNRMIAFNSPKYKIPHSESYYSLVSNYMVVLSDLNLFLNNTLMFSNQFETKNKKTISLNNDMSLYISKTDSTFSNENLVNESNFEKSHYLLIQWIESYSTDKF
ncbi:hypothetical protein [Vibrio anguillarum]|uniref:hypothetical protein n=1 Tax=Vibrio anguillarum TaxID=55601 RepID=UPI0009836281|nr:hypothetical protein [Vibrio anguillarum]AUB86557.1 hypothetical protein CKY00_04410 [Vibrio anguillarum]AUB89053.1 hypothetical protein CKY00_17795 [Vibrio anguillarum]AUB89998.1 hypothetical protein CKX99_04420 [Vibrio anguillarum]AUB92494.1 hypothetical protein CKX99_17810 [Vibrio anguillarum]AUB93439.1 hypothetical protein CK210_04415 [Vibrio anguillarum]